MDTFVGFSLRCLVFLLISTNVSSDYQNCFGKYCFTYPGAEVTLSIDDARAWCAENNSSTLADVNNESAHNALVQFLSASNIFSSLYINEKVDKSNEDTWYFITGDKLEGSVEDQPTDKNSDYQFYASFNQWSVSFGLLDSSPQELKNYICKFKDGAGLNILSNIYTIYNGSVYIKYENETLNWFEARNRCYLRGGDLATFVSLSSFDTSWLNLSRSYWIGLRWNNWRWENKDTGSEIIYSRWSSGKPSNFAFQCVCVDWKSSWNWTDCDCSIKRSFVCVKYGSYSSTLSTTPNLRAATSAQNVTRNSETSTENSKLAIGVGVGVGGGVLIILIVVVVIIVVKTRKRKRDTTDFTESKTKGKLHKESKETKVKQLTTDFDGYAEIQAVAQSGTREPPRKPIVYATPEFVPTT